MQIVDALTLPGNEDHGYRVTVRDSSNLRGVSQMFYSFAAPEPSEQYEQFFYGNPWDKPLQMMGLAQYYNTLNPANAQNSINVIDARSRTKHLTSIFFICWDEETVFLSRPPNAADDDPALATVIKDWRYIVRIANLSPTASTVDVKTAMAQAMLRVPRIKGTAVFYMRSDMRRRLGMKTFRGAVIRSAPLSDREKRVA